VKEPVTVVGAGLAGALLATLLARRGLAVTVFERRPDPRLAGYQGGRSINLALAERGLHGLRRAGLAREIMERAVMMRGRYVHGADGHAGLQRYGRDDSEVIWSINRGDLNRLLVDAAEQAGARVVFDRRLAGVVFSGGVVELVVETTGAVETHQVGVVIGADGAGSTVRQAMNAEIDLGETVEPLGHSYKELEIPPLSGGGFALEPNALHIWPRGGYMCIALPNPEATFTVTLFLPTDGEPSVASIETGRQARAWFDSEFADLSPLIPDLEVDFDTHPTGSLSTLRLERWSLGGRAALIGDAAHAMVPFHGQGMNCAFEDCVELDDLVGERPTWEETFAEYEHRRLSNSQAIQLMAVENYQEMRDRVVDPRFLLQKELERILADRHPSIFVPRYTMVTFRRVPYRVAYERGEDQRRILEELTAGRTAIEEVDLAAGDELVTTRLTPLG